MRRSVLAWTLPLILFFLPLASQADEPDLTVARASYVRGDVSYQRGDDEGWNGLGMNTPLMTGDSLYTSSDARLEVNLGGGNVARLDGGTQLDLVNHSWDIGQLGLSEGYLNLRARSVPETYTLEVATPIAAATILEPGLYRIEVTGGTATYSVVQGSLAVALNGQQLDVYEGESLELDGPR